MTVNISSSDKRILEEAVNSGLYKDTQEALREAIFLLREKTATQDGNVLSNATWRDRLHQHLTNTPATEATFVDDSRESIYEGRGE
ncbi:hypothetical protein [Bythopirellula goksoeyrii]|uniref:Antitoxin ParD1 n=1 Tax=Bythopirellula goksoeyrii TaxID=1400387 RepID=A0A5B9Q7D8_9BACT|nr:hypothetical protein [Bythopirellula goksoeyrii]QEG34907.1 hypothetical protein Pr1d_21950 [Bythopirellula goksoeyrii]